jgi:iron complex transport system substrate-binding protein
MARDRPTGRAFGQEGGTMRPGARSIAVTSIVFVLVGVSCRAEEPVRDRPSPEAAFPVTVTDDDGVEVTIPAEPKRIVTFAPSNTEIVFALGLGDRLVGVSGDFDDYPPEAQDIEHVGGAGEFGVDPNAERLVSLEPDLMLTIAGGEHWKESLRDLDVPVFTVNATDFDDLLHDIETVGRITGATDAARSLTEEMVGDAESIAEGVAPEPRATCFFEVFFPPLTTVGPNTFIFDLLDRAGCDPVSAGANSDYPEWSVDRLVTADPDVYLVSSESGQSADAVAKRPAFGELSSVQSNSVVLIDSDLISRPGPRVVEGLRALAEALHPAAV